MISSDTLAIEHVAIGTLRPAEYNPRTMSADARKRLTRSIREFGLVDPIIARRSDNLVIGGHQRLIAAQELHLTTVPVIYLDDIDDQRAAALNVALNNPTEQGSWDFPKLTELLSTLDAEGFDATLTGFSEDDLGSMLSWAGAGPESALGAGSSGESDQWICAVTCTNERELAALYDRLTAEGFACKLIT